MRKIFTFAFALMAMLALNAAERTVWTGNEPISWNTEVYAGSQFETPEGIFAGLVKDDTIKVTVIAQIESPQYVMTYKAGTGWEWTDLAATVEEGIMSYVVESEQIATEIADRGLVFRGQGYDMTQIVVASADQEPVDPIDPQEPGEEYDFTAVWTGDKAISWNTEVYAGEQFDTYVSQQDMFAGLANGDSIKVFYADAIEGAQFAASYKAGEEWTWTDLAITEHAGFYAYKVATDEMAQLIADRGIVLRGQGYHAVRIEIGKPASTSGIETVSGERLSVKVIRNGQVLLIREDGVYNLFGQKIK